MKDYVEKIAGHKHNKPYKEKLEEMKELISDETEKRVHHNLKRFK